MLALSVEVLEVLEDVLVRLLEVLDVGELEIFVFDVLGLDVEVPDTEVLEVLVLLEDVLVLLVEVLDVEVLEILVLD